MISRGVYSPSTTKRPEDAWLFFLLDPRGKALQLACFEITWVCLMLLAFDRRCCDLFLNSSQSG